MVEGLFQLLVLFLSSFALYFSMEENRYPIFPGSWELCVFVSGRDVTRKRHRFSRFSGPALDPESL